MITYIELWKAKKTWMDLSEDQRANYLAALGPAIQQLMEAGVQIISWGKNEDATANRAEYDYFAVWTFPDFAATENFETIVEGAGWYNYFDQVNLKGSASNPQDVMAQMIKM